jgi:hypothetical protein
MLKGTVLRFFASAFFHESVSPKPQRLPLGPFQSFQQICGDNGKKRFSTGINDTSDKFATSILRGLGEPIHEKKQKSKIS